MSIKRSMSRTIKNDFEKCLSKVWNEEKKEYQFLTSKYHNFYKSDYDSDVIINGDKYHYDARGCLHKVHNDDFALNLKK